LNVPTPAFKDVVDVAIFETAVARFLDDHAHPSDIQRWRDDGVVDRELSYEAGRAGLRLHAPTRTCACSAFTAAPTRS